MYCGVLFTSGVHLVRMLTEKSNAAYIKCVPETS